MARPRRKRVHKNEKMKRRSPPLHTYIPSSSEDGEDSRPTSSRENDESCGDERLRALLQVPEKLVFALIVIYTKEFVDRIWPTGYIVFFVYLFIFLLSCFTVG